MAGSKIDFGTVVQALQANNAQMHSGNILSGDKVYSVRTGNFFSSVEEVKNTIVGVTDGHPVYLHQIASVEDGPEVPRNYVSFGFGSANPELRAKHPSDYAAV